MDLMAHNFLIKYKVVTVWNLHLLRVVQLCENTTWSSQLGEKINPVQYIALNLWCKSCDGLDF